MEAVEREILEDPVIVIDFDAFAGGGVRAVEGRAIDAFDG